jgi:hypothetical protein
MKLKKKQLKPLINALDYKINKFTESRKRDRFTKLIEIEDRVFENEKLVIIRKLCIKDKKGKPIEHEGGIYHFEGKNKDTFIKEFDILKNEEVNINTEMTLPELRVLVEKSTKEFGIGDTLELEFLYE